MNHTVKFSLMLTLEIPAILISTLIFVHYALNRQVRSKLENHGWFVLLTVNSLLLVVDLPMAMSFYLQHGIWPALDSYCIWWTWFEFSLNTIGLFLMAWISVERHIFIFQPRAMTQGRWRKWMFHYTPIVLCLLWTPIFYMVIVVVSPFCTTVWDFNAVICGVPCYLTVDFLGQFDFIFNIASPIIIMMLANVALVIRVIRQKRALHQAINWRHHRRMVLQLWIVSSLYMAFWFPLTVTQFVQITVMPSFMIDQLETILFLVYFTPLFLPMICLSTLPELVKTMMAVVKRAKRNVVGVVAVIENRPVGQKGRN